MSAWITKLPKEFVEIPDEREWDAMTGASSSSSKRPRSDSNGSEINLVSDTEINLVSDTETNTTLSRESKNSIYKDVRYAQVMKSKNSFMHDSEQGPLPEELELFKTLQSKKAVLPHADKMPRERVGRLRDLLRNRSELRVCIDLHPYLVPSAESPALQYPEEIRDLTEGHNDRWLDNVVFYKKLPQPDRTLAFAYSAFTEVERCKLGLSPERKSPFLACHGSLFPFFTAEVKCGKEGLDTADNANLNSMTVALRAVVELYRRTGQAAKVHRRFLGFSMSHDDGWVRIYGHYPEIYGDEIKFYRRKGRAFAYDDNDAAEWDTAAQFVRNVQTTYASLHLKRLKEAIECLRDPLAPSANSRTPSRTPTASGDDNTPLTPITTNSGPTFVKPGPPRRHTSATVAQQSEQQHRELMLRFEQLQKDAKEREDGLQAQLRQLQKDAKEREDELRQQQREAKEREDKLLAQLEQQQKQHTQLMQVFASKLASTEGVNGAAG